MYHDYQTMTMRVRKIYKCPHCNAFFEASDYKEDRVCCQYCDNEIGTSAYVEVEDEKKLIEKLFSNDEKIEQIFSIKTKLERVHYFLICLCTVPFFYAGHHWIYGEPVRWWLWLLMILGASMIYVIITTPKTDCKKLASLKEVVKRHNYSLASISTEIPILQKKIKEFQDSSSISAVDRESDCKVLLENIQNLNIYIASQGQIKEDYSSYQGKGILAGETQSTDADNTLIYITQPSRCPGCNYIYKVDELKANTVVCPDCSTVISIAGASVQKQIQKKIYDFLIGIAASDKNKSMYKVFLVLFLFSAGISSVLAIWLGPLEYFCSWAILSLIFTTIIAVIGLSFYYGPAYTLRNAAGKGISDMLELEYLVRTYALHLENEYDILKADVIKMINNK